MHSLCLCGVLWQLVPVGPDFSSPNPTSSTNSRRSGQIPLDIRREKSGQAIQSKAKDYYPYKLSFEEGRLLGQVALASESRKWSLVRSLLDNYTGTAESIYAAAINAAFKCREYKEGALIYDQCRQRFSVTHMPIFNAALRVFGKCGEPERVLEVWQDALAAGDLDQNLASARISAAADAGDVEAAAEVLDKMIKGNVSVNVIHMTEAIRSCKGRGQNQHQAAKYLLDWFPKLGIQPNIITFSSLMKTYTTAPLEDILSAYKEMNVLKLQPNKVFAELYMIAIFQGLRLSGEPDQIAKTLSNMAVERLRAARDTLNDFQKAGVELTLLTRKIGKALKILSF